MKLINEPRHIMKIARSETGLNCSITLKWLKIYIVLLFIIIAWLRCQEQKQFQVVNQLQKCNSLPIHSSKEKMTPSKSEVMYLFSRPDGVVGRWGLVRCLFLAAGLVVFITGAGVTSLSATSTPSFKISRTGSISELDTAVSSDLFDSFSVESWPASSIGGSKETSASTGSVDSPPGMERQDRESDTRMIRKYLELLCSQDIFKLEI